MQPVAEPSKDLVDVTRVPLGTLRSSGLARAAADELVGGRAAVQEQNMEQYDDDYDKDVTDE